MESPDWILIDKTAKKKLQFCIINKTLVFVPLEKRKRSICRFESLFDLTGLQLSQHQIGLRFREAPQEWYHTKSALDIFKYIKTQCAIHKPAMHNQMQEHIKVLCEALDVYMMTPETSEYIHRYNLCHHLTICTLCLQKNEKNNLLN